MDRKILVLLPAGLLVFALALIACGPQPSTTPCPPSAPCPDCPERPECPEGPEAMVEAPFEEMWASSAHADAAAEAFTNWDEEDPQEIPGRCARCHSTPGYLDYLGADGSEAGTVDAAAPVGTVLSCTACHNEVTQDLTAVAFPSGAEVAGLGPEARCMICHQGRASKASVDDAIASAGLTDMDIASADLGFTNIHYFAAAASQYGTMAMGGYQYDGRAYDAKFDHVPGYDACVDCHDSHTLEVKVEECSTCHAGVASAEDLKDVRMASSLVDYDGDGDISEGIYYEVVGLQGMLYQAMQAYASEVSGKPIVYDAHIYPYFFVDSNTNGEADPDEANYGNRYDVWTGRLAKAAYNFQISVKDPGTFAHGGKYIIQLLYDSIEDLNTVIASPIDLSAAHRIDAGHFAGSEEAFRHWDEEGEVSGSCAKCHSGAGLPVFLVNGTNIAEHTSNGLLCATCHDDLVAFTRYEVGAVTFPSGARVDSGVPDANLCLICHQGRESTTSVDAAVKGMDDDTISESLRFRNVHYFAAGATLFGGDAKGAYQYADKEYLGVLNHVDGFETCIQCHDTHALTVNDEACAGCHGGAVLEDIRMSPIDYDGDGDATEGLAGEIETLHEALYTALQAYSADVAGTGLVYDSHSYPYFFNDTNGNGVLDPEEITRENGFSAWTPRLLRAAYNYQYAAKDPGAFAHNGKYVIQVLYDSLEDLGADVTGMVRP